MNSCMKEKLEFVKQEEVELKRYISVYDRKSYTHMLEIILAIGGNDLKYKWLITDITAYPQDNGQYDNLLENNNYLILSNKDLIKMLSEYDFQWIWAVFSAIPENISDDVILKYKLPYADGNTEIYKDNVAIIQHPLADIEIVAEDSTSVFIVSKENHIADKFRNLFPMAKINY